MSELNGNGHLNGRGWPKGKPKSLKARINMSNGSKGKILSQSHKEKLGNILIKVGLKTRFNKDFKQSRICVKCDIIYSATHMRQKYCLTCKDMILIERGKRFGGDVDKWRNEVFKRDGYKCLRCGGGSGNLNAHHQLPWKQYPQFRFDMDNGITLCKPCHKFVHSYFGYKHCRRHPLLDEMNEADAVLVPLEKIT